MNATDCRIAVALGAFGGAAIGASFEHLPNPAAILCSIVGIACNTVAVLAVSGAR